MVADAHAPSSSRRLSLSASPLAAACSPVAGSSGSSMWRLVEGAGGAGVLRAVAVLTAEPPPPPAYPRAAAAAARYSVGACCCCCSAPSEPSR